MKTNSLFIPMRVGTSDSVEQSKMVAREDNRITAENSNRIR